MVRFDSKFAYDGIKTTIKDQQVFSNIVAIMRMYLLSYIDVLEILKNTFLAWKKTNIERISLDY